MSQRSVPHHDAGASLTLIRREEQPPAPARSLESRVLPGTKRATVLLLGPSLGAPSGVSTHLNQLLASELAAEFDLRHFQVGSEGRGGGWFRTVARLLVSPVALAASIGRTNARIVHINSSLEPKAYWRDIAYVLVARLMCRKTIWQLHGGAPPLEFLPGLLGAWWLRLTLSLPDVIVVLADSELRAYRELLPGRRIVLIPNSISVPESPPGKPGIRSRPVDGPLRLVYVGRLARDKGLFEIIEAMDLLRTAGVPVHLTVAGSGGCEAPLREAVANLGLADSVTFSGAVFGNQKLALWSSAHVFAFPTYHREGLPYALLEAMMAGAVPVTCPVGAIVDVIEDGQHGVFVPPRDPAHLANAIERLARDRRALSAMSEAAELRVRSDYTVSRMVRQFASVYDDVAGSNPGRAST